MSYHQALSPVLIGRAEQLRTLEEHLASGEAGQGRMVLIAGDAGVGKTRLVNEFLSRARDLRAAEVLVGHCYEEEPAMAYRPVVEALRAWSRRRDASTLVRLAGPWVGDLARLMPDLGGEKPAALAEGEAPAMKWRLFEGVAQLWRPGPSDPVRLIVFEDLHWSDQSSLDLIRSLARGLDSDRVLVLGTFRSDELHRRHPMAHWLAQLERERMAVVVRLAPLNREEVWAMVNGILGRNVPERMVAALHDHSGGNPFLVEEILKTLMERGELERLMQSTQQGRGLGGVVIPLSVRDSVLGRMEGLDEPTLEALRYAAVIGRAFDFELLLTLTGRDEADLLRSIGVLVERQLVVEQTEEGMDRYQFRHALTREAIYEELLGRERRRMHREVLQAMERIPGAASDGRLDMLAYHSLQARDLEKAADYAVQAAEKAMRALAFREAVAHLEVALELKEAAPAEERAELLYRLGLASHPLGEVSVYRRYLEGARELYQQLGHRKKVADIDLRISRAAWESGKTKEAFEFARAGLALLEKEPRSSELAMAYSTLSQLHMLSNQHKEAIAWGKKALGLADELGDRRVSVHAWNNMGCAMVDMGDVDEGLDYLKRSLETAVEAGLAFDATRAGNNLGSILANQGRFAEAMTWLKKAEEIGTRAGFLLSKSFVWANQGSVGIQIGEWAEAEKALDRAIRAGESGFPVSLVAATPWRAYLHAMQGNPTLALELIDSVRAEVEAEGSFENLREFYPVLAECQYLADRPDEAEETLDRCMEHWRKVGRVVGVAFVLGVGASLYLRMGRPGKVTELIQGLRDVEARTSDAWATAWRALVEGLLLASQGSLTESLKRLDESVSAFDACGSAFQQARARTERARVRLMCEDREAAKSAAEDWKAAKETFERLGARTLLASAEDLDRVVGAAAPARSEHAGRLQALTPREREVLALLARGLSNRQIAQELVIAVKTVEIHVSNVLAKLDLKSRSAAAALAAEEGLTAGGAG